MILFWDDDRYRFLSNFYPSPFEAEGLKWPTIEHFYQAMKTTNKDKWKEFARITTPLKAKRMGRRVQIRPDWEEIKVDVMLRALRLKFQIPELKQKLLDTGNEILHEDSPFDHEWGWRNGGRDLLGKCLIKVREELRRRAPAMKKYSLGNIWRGGYGLAVEMWTLQECLACLINPDVICNSCGKSYCHKCFRRDPFTGDPDCDLSMRMSSPNNRHAYKFVRPDNLCEDLLAMQREEKANESSAP